jgi:CHAT domain-containing protein
LGEIKAGEGVFGLRRAFAVAGAKTVIMSLWPVEDEAARVWMKVVYEEKFGRNVTTAEAVRESSLRLLRQQRAEGRQPHPSDWGCFVAAGDWR